MIMTKSMGKPSCTQGITGTGVQKCTEGSIATQRTEPITTDEKTKLKTDSQLVVRTALPNAHSPVHAFVNYNPF